ncbi:MAG TPA: MFS transporter [Solirubrobacteraceae bacterium]|nr:MFS transporter [Solirubrobacteraceae bacterium]
MALDPHELGSRRWWALGAVTLAVLAVGLDGTVLSVALPTLAVKLHASESDLEWFSSIYLLVLAASMLPAGLLGDRYGHKKVMLIALALFGIGSTACAASTSSADFIAARVLMGGAGAGVIVMALSALTVLFDEQERPKAVGVWSAANFLSFPIGPILGGWLLSHVWWGWVFLMNVPVVLVGLTATALLIPESRASHRPALDPVGIVLSVAGLVGVTYGLIEAGQHGWGDAVALGAIVAGLALLAGFFGWERRLNARPDGEPLIDVALFRSRAYTWGVILIAVAVLAMMGVLFTMPQYFQGVVGTDAMGSGVRLLPLVGGLVIGAIPADRVARRLGAKLTVCAGFVALAAGLALGSGTKVGSSEGFVAAWMALVGAGMGLALATASSAALSELSEERSGIGSAVLQAVNKTGGPLGTAILGSILSAGYLTGLHVAGLPPAVAGTAKQSIFGAVAVAARLGSPSLLDSARVAFVHGMDRSLMVSAGIAAAGAVLSLLFLPGIERHRAEGPATPGTDLVRST